MNALQGISSVHDLESWKIAIGVVGLGISVALTVVGWGLASWSKRLEGMGEKIDSRLCRMEEAGERRWTDIERKMDRHETRIHDLHVQVERRVTMLEARFVAHNPHAGNLE
jgi:hypothetical protein